MCGITGCLWTDPSGALAREALRKMTEALVHRGPDEEGSYFGEYQDRGPYPACPGIALGFRRLSIIDVAGSRQPLANEDGSIRLIFNGEIFNFRDLRRRLEGAGHTFGTTGDGETIIHLYEDEGLGFLDHLVGMFAIALWDERNGRLVLARDRLGQKPLVYRQEPHRLLFASELKSILAAPDVPREVDPRALDAYLTFGYVPYPMCILRGIHKLPPGHYAVFEKGRLTVQPYWQPDFNVEEPPAPARHAAELTELLTEAVRLRLESEVPLGAFLSGGIDSSIIAALAQQQSAHQLRTFSIGFSIAEYDESPYARRVAEHLGTEHHEFRVEPSGVDLLPKLVWHYDEPFGDSSAIPTFYLSQLTRQHVTVALSGDGGDELFAGYPRYRAVRLSNRFDRMPEAVRAILASRLWQRMPSSDRSSDVRRRLKRFLQTLQAAPEPRYGNRISVFKHEHRASLYSDDFMRNVSDYDPLDFVADAYARSRRRDFVTSTTLADLLTYLPGDLCCKVDIASMANSLECRQPLLDHRVVEFAARLPLSEKLRGSRGKQILRAAFGHLLPSEVFTRPKKGFSVPLGHWFRGELRGIMREVLLDARTLQRPYFRAGAIERLIEEHLSCRVTHGGRLWSLLILELWHREWIDRG